MDILQGGHGPLPSSWFTSEDLGELEAAQLRARKARDAVAQLLYLEAQRLVDDGHLITIEDLVMWYCELRAEEMETEGHSRALENKLLELVDLTCEKGTFEKTESFKYKTEKSRERQDAGARILRIAVEIGVDDD